MKKMAILSIDEDHQLQQDLSDLLWDQLGATLEVASDKESALQICKERVFDVIVIDPMLPTSFDGEDVIQDQRNFYSINIDTPILIFTEEIEFASHLAEKFAVHIESKKGPLRKILNPLRLSLGNKIKVSS